jgi:uncharacterized protein YegL
MGQALSMVAEQLQMPPMEARGLPPVLVLISDGQPTDNFQQGLSALMALPWGKKAVRIAIGIGEDADHEVLKQFIGNLELSPLRANNPEALIDYIKWVSTAVLKSASSPSSQTSDPHSPQSHVSIPVASAPTPNPSSADDVW